MPHLPTLALLAAFAAAAAAQNASYTLYGTGCNGAGVSHCIRQNDQNPSHRLASLPNEYAYPVIHGGTQPMQIVGFDMFTRSNSGLPVTGNTAIYLDNAGAGTTVHSIPALTAAATGTITVTGTVGWFTTIVEPPVIVQPGEAFWLGADAFSMIAPPQSNGGTPSPATIHWRRPTYMANAWNASGSVSLPILRVHCAGGTVDVPALTNSGNPRLGQQFTLQIGGEPFLPAFLIWAFDDSAWLSLPIPVDLALLGAPGCFVWTSSDAPVFLFLDAQGQASFAATVPNQPVLAGFRFFNQVAATSPLANPVGIAVTNAGTGLIGN